MCNSKGEQPSTEDTVADLTAEVAELKRQSLVDLQMAREIANARDEVVKQRDNWKSRYEAGATIMRVTERELVEVQKQRDEASRSFLESWKELSDSHIKAQTDLEASNEALGLMLDHARQMHAFGMSNCNLCVETKAALATQPAADPASQEVPLAWRPGDPEDPPIFNPDDLADPAQGEEDGSR